MPAARRRATAPRTWSMVSPLSIASSTDCAPDSTPIHVSAQPARPRPPQQAAIPEDQARHPGGRVQVGEQLAEGELSLADGDEVRARAEVELRRVRGIVA